MERHENKENTHFTAAKATPKVETIEDHEGVEKAVEVQETVKSTDTDFPIVGIGASAGGLEALEQFLRNVPEASGIGFVIIQHLDPTCKGMMTEILQRVTGMKVFQVVDRMRVKPNCVYVIPPNKDLSILHGVLHLFEPTTPRGLRLSIDFFLRSLASDLQGVTPTFVPKVQNSAPGLNGRKRQMIIFFRYYSMLS